MSFYCLCGCSGCFMVRVLGSFEAWIGADWMYVPRLGIWYEFWYDFFFGGVEPWIGADWMYVPRLWCLLLQFVSIWGKIVVRIHWIAKPLPSLCQSGLKLPNVEGLMSNNSRMIPYLLSYVRLVTGIRVLSYILREDPFSSKKQILKDIIYVRRQLWIAWWHHWLHLIFSDFRHAKDRDHRAT